MKNKKGFTLAELLIVVAIIAVLVAIAIPVFTSQLEKAREATDLANVRSAYAEIITEYLTSGSDSSTDPAELPTEKNVPVTQKKAEWQCESGTDKTKTTIAKEISVPAKTTGNYVVRIDANGTVTVE
ncbi:MAG: type II secretion system GspH family protein [Solobacterium sp.]|nr:type II secretion system GspH family protein [Solobacterium sp.]MCI7156072.1 type II secretion system GspH family protein [Solobacterium sp.]MDY3794185.1 type II secretion system protein [Erysipelotrichaceae bacterium]MDY5401830.1 type II secretion system protein [Erysipelotrichaceae bacterium]